MRLGCPHGAPASRAQAGNTVFMKSEINDVDPGSLHGIYNAWQLKLQITWLLEFRGQQVAVPRTKAAMIKAWIDLLQSQPWNTDSGSPAENASAQVDASQTAKVRPPVRNMLAHARQLASATGGESRDQCINLLFRGGPCDVCGGPCFATLSDTHLINRLLTGKKPAGTIARKSRWVAGALAKLLQSRGLTTWKGQNKWGMYVVVACLHPDTFIPEAMGTPGQVAFTQAFIDEVLPFAVTGALYGYPSCGLY